MEEVLEFAVTLAEEVGEMLREAWARDKVVHFKGSVDLVTETDRQSERWIVDRIRRRFPDHVIVAEEGGGDAIGTNAGDRCVWYVDPLDGTTNFAHSYPHFAVSLGVARAGRLEVGVVRDPMRGETFAARRGAGATCNGVPIRVSPVEALDGALMGTGFPYDRRERAEYYLAFVGAVLKRVQGMRRAGTASLDLCYVASGRLDGFFEMKLKPWDVAAGAVILLEAGGAVSDYRGDSFDPCGDQIVASNSKIHSELVGVLAEVLSSAGG